MSNVAEQPPAQPAAPPAAPPSAQPIVVIAQKGNGLGVTGFVLGLLGALAGLIPLLFFIAFPLGFLGVIFGGLGWRTASRDPARGGKGLSIAGTILGVIAVGLAILGVAIIDSAFSS